MKLRSFLLSILMVFGLAAPATAGQLADFGGSKVDVPTPDGWATQGGAPMVLAMSPDKAAVLIYSVSEAADLGKAVKSIEALLAKHVSNVKLGKKGKTKINGMGALAAKGTAKDLADGKPLAIAVVILETPSKKALIVVGVVDAAKKQTYKSVLEQILAGIKPS